MEPPLILVEGFWTAWNPWDTCLGICDSDATRFRTRSFTGGDMPCSGNATEEEACAGEIFITLQPQKEALVHKVARFHCLPLSLLQLKAHGAIGMPGVHA